MSKEGLQKVIQQEQIDNQMQQVRELDVYVLLFFPFDARFLTYLFFQGNFLSTDDLRDLFTFHENVR